uniref:Palmitoyltransferase n=1 Tax=Globisporangium ultimum (strain ATCC 200006 / CBS 805.95 / DAOM BR144) TaxID=431595 RepID=K3W6G6_GLOUD
MDIGPLFVGVGYFLLVALGCVHFVLFLPLHTASSSRATWSGVHYGVSMLLMAQLLLQYSLAVWSNPGYVTFIPATRAPATDAAYDGDTCKKCAHVKPERAHHCRVCRTCVLEMDHHCPWINNCVGLYNYRFFWLLLMYLWISCMYASSISWEPFRHVLHTQRLKYYNRNSSNVFAQDLAQRLQNVLILFSFLVTSTLGVVLFGYWTWHFYLVFSQQTTIEFAIRRSRSKEKRHGAAFGASQLCGRRQSLLRNFQRMLGRHDTWWFIALVLPLPQRDFASSREAGASDALESV